jgi:hypothetical protein
MTRETRVTTEKKPMKRIRSTATTPMIAMRLKPMRQTSQTRPTPMRRMTAMMPTRSTETTAN